MPEAGAAASSTDGRLLFDVTGKDDYGTVYTVSPNGHGLRGLVYGDHAAWSPDRRNIVFVSPFDGVFVIRADGTKRRRVPGTADLYRGSPRWSPDGRSIAIETDDGIAVYPIAGGIKHTLEVYGEEESPDWAPDGRLAFAVSYPGLGAIFVVDSRLANPRQLTRPGRDTSDSDPRWSPDGRSLIFIRSVETKTRAGFSTRSRILQVPARGGRPIVIRSWPGGIESVAWSPNGLRIAYVAFTRRAGDWGIQEIHVYELSSGKDRVLDLDVCRKWAAMDGSTCGNVDW